METNKSTWGQKLAAFKQDLKCSLYFHTPTVFTTILSFDSLCLLSSWRSLFLDRLYFCDLYSRNCHFLFHRERDRELHGPKKRGPKPKNFVMKVHFYILTGSNGILWTLQHISSWKRILPKSIFFNCSHDLSIHYLPALIQQHVTGSGEVLCVISFFFF